MSFVFSTDPTIDFWQWLKLRREAFALAQAREAGDWAMDRRAVIRCKAANHHDAIDKRYFEAQARVALGHIAHYYAGVTDLIKAFAYLSQAAEGARNSFDRFALIDWPPGTTEGGKAWAAAAAPMIISAIEGRHA